MVGPEEGQERFQVLPVGGNGKGGARHSRHHLFDGVHVQGGLPAHELHRQRPFPGHGFQPFIKFGRQFLCFLRVRLPMAVGTVHIAPAAQVDGYAFHLDAPRIRLYSFQTSYHFRPSLILISPVYPSG